MEHFPTKSCPGEGRDGHRFVERKCDNAKNRIAAIGARVCRAAPADDGAGGVSDRGNDSLRDYTFLYELGLDDIAIAEWRIKANRLGLSLHDALRYDGRIDDMAYTRALGRMLRVAVIEPGRMPPLELAHGESPQSPRLAVAPGPHRNLYVIDALARPPAAIRRLVDDLVGAPEVDVALTEPAAIRQAIVRRLSGKLSADAVGHLSHFEPAYSAARRMWLWQAIGLAVIGGMLAGAVFMSPVGTAWAGAGVLAAIFAAVVMLRILALAASLATPIVDREPVRLPVVALPVYSVLVPLFREARVVPDLIRALKRLNYPRSRLDIKLILEAVDEETQRSVAALPLGPEFEVVVVPDSQPRTKPKALNYALNFVRGDYLVIYDAEDIPEPDQLLRALAVFRGGDDSIGAVQARLAIDNPGDGWLARQFALEYLALFDGLLPALDRLDLPVPLGGTSTHFPTEVVRRVGGWDPHNVTEDADLGMRLARLGYRCRCIASRTYEEAPFHLGAWIRQRTRWLKGWMQTLLVHTREPFRLVRELGMVGAATFIALLGGTLLSAIVHPVSLGIVAWQAYQGELMAWSGAPVGDAILTVSAANLVLGYAGAMLLVLVSAIRRRAWRLIPSIALVPLYWLLISVAVYRAFLQLLTDPHKWEKTEHGLSQRRRPPKFNGRA
jgi:cellulose synthase/poly-beta-1,6-N-acetylglucosamine synthase-like glycosyltransferase